MSLSDFQQCLAKEEQQKWSLLMFCFYSESKCIAYYPFLLFLFSNCHHLTHIQLDFSCSALLEGMLLESRMVTGSSQTLSFFLDNTLASHQVCQPWSNHEQSESCFLKSKFLSFHKAGATTSVDRRPYDIDIHIWWWSQDQHTWGFVHLQQEQRRTKDIPEAKPPLGFHQLHLYLHQPLPWARERGSLEQQPPPFSGHTIITLVLQKADVSNFWITEHNMW